MSDLEGKVVVITGANSGIGAATARAFAREGARLCLAGLDAQGLETVAGECRQVAGRAGLEVVCVPGDVTVDEHVGEIVAAAVGRLGGVDVLVNCAGVLKLGGIVDGSLDDLDLLYRVLVRAAYSLTQKALPSLVASSRGGCVVNVCSHYCVIPAHSAMAYSAMKAAVAHLTRCLALELAPMRVRVNAVNPGATRTPLLFTSGMVATPEESIARQASPEVTARHPLGRTAEPGEIADAIVFLASARAGFITGAGLTIDGGAFLREGGVV